MPNNNALIQTISLKDEGYSQNIKKAQESLKELAKANGLADVQMRNVNKEASAAKRYLTNLTYEYNKLSDAAKKSQFGRELKAQIDQAKQAAQDFKKVSDQINSDINGIGKNGGGGGFDLSKIGGDLLSKAGLGNIGGMLSGGAMAAGAAFGGLALAVKGYIDVAKVAIDKSAEFGQAMSELGAQANLTEAQMASMRSAMMEVGKDTVTSFKDVTDIAKEVESAFNLGDSEKQIKATTTAIITLAKSGIIPFNEASSQLIQTLQRFNLEASDAQNVVNLIDGTMKNGGGTISQVAQALSAVGVSAHQAGVSIEQTAALIAILGQRGVKGADAVTVLTRTFETMNASGINDIQPSMVGLTQALENAEQHMDKFGKRGQSNVDILIDNAQRVDELTRKIQEAGDATQTWERNEANLAAQWDDTKTMWDNFLASFNVDGANSPLMVVVQQIQNIISALDEMVETVKQSEYAASTAEGYAELFRTIGVAVEALIDIVNDFLKTFYKITDSTKTFSVTTDALNITLKVLQEILEDIAVAYKLLSNGIQAAIDKFNEWTGDIRQTAGSIPFLDTVLQTFEDIKNAIESAWEKWQSFKSSLGMGEKDNGKKGRNNDRGEKNNIDKNIGGTTTTYRPTKTYKTTTTKNKPDKKDELNPDSLRAKIEKARKELQNIADNEGIVIDGVVNLKYVAAQNELDKLLKQQQDEIQAAYLQTNKGIQESAQKNYDEQLKSEAAFTAQLRQQLEERKKAKEEEKKAQVQAINDQATAYGAYGQILGGVGNALGRLMDDEAAATAQFVTNSAQMVMQAIQTIMAMQAQATASGVASGAKLPFPANLAAIATIVATIGSIFASLPKFADGGIVNSVSNFGDKQLIRVNGGEMVLNSMQQKNLFDLLDGGFGGSAAGGQVEFEIKGDKLVGVLRNYNRIKGATNKIRL